jgi:hypothetical protein
MEEIKQYILDFLWQGNSVSQFENWLYNQDSIKFEKILDEESYVELVSYDFKNKTIKQLKTLIKSVLKNELIEEFEIEFRKREKSLKGVCLKREAINYSGTEIRKWDVEIGKQYEFIILSTELKKGNHSGLVEYVDRKHYFRPSGFVPMELFDIDLKNLSELYHKIKNENEEVTIEPVSWSKNNYNPSK